MPSRLENALPQLEYIEPIIARELLDLCIQKIDGNVNSKRFYTLPGAEFYPEIISAVYGIFNALKNQI
jgi:hypothetical protein